MSVVTILEIANCALRRDALLLRSLVQDFVRSHHKLDAVGRPDHDNQFGLSAAAGILELLAERSGQVPPQWAAEIGQVPVPTFLVQSAETMPRLRELCIAESPEPLRRRLLYAPPDFLRFA